MAETALLVSSIITALLVGVVYGVVTLGLNIIFGVLRIVNVGHGAFVMLGAYITYFLYKLYGVNPVLSVPVSLAVGFALGYALYYAVFRRLVGAPELSTLLATFAVGVLIQEFARIVWSPNVRGFIWDIGGVEVAGARIVYSKVVAAAVALALVAGVYALFTRTRFGLAVRAVVQDPEGAMVVGINVDRIYALSMALGLGVTTASGSILAIYLQQGIEPYMGIPYTLLSFVIAVMAGLGSILGSLYAGVIFGFFSSASFLLFSAVKDAVALDIQPAVLTRSAAFFLLLLTLLLKPEGLFRR
jgi:branched-chain amino acid transport system permease protein